VDIKKIAILGAGSMGTAILSGLLKAGFDAANVAVSTNSVASADRLAKEFGVTAHPIEANPDANANAVIGADVVLVAVKPFYVTEVLAKVSANLNTAALVISVAAGVTTARMESAVPESVGVIRSMPNTPAIVGRAVTGLARGSRASEQQLTKAISLFETVGKVVVLDENQIDELGTVSGSGPAYVFFLIEKFTAAAINLGFDAETAHLLVSETFLGASELLAASGKTPAELRRQVTSPNGTTERAIAQLELGNLEALFGAATAAALARSKELAAGN
jgi:pyrroline-5-carboxylate reductase